MSGCLTFIRPACLSLFLMAVGSGCGQPEPAVVDQSDLDGTNPNLLSYDTGIFKEYTKDLKPKFKKIVYFGDSLTDEGLAYKLTKGLLPNRTFFHGRFSNGPVWPEYIRGSLNVPDLNLAVGGAASDAENSYVHATLPYLGKLGFPTPISQSIVSHVASTSFDSRDTLYIVWGGPNDFFSNQQNAKSVAANIKAGAERLLKHGATMVLIPQMFALEGMPHNVPQIKVPPDEILSRVTKEFNTAVVEMVQDLSKNYPNSVITTLDPESNLTKIKTDPSLIGLDNTKDACYVGGAVFGSGGEHKITCENPDRYLFWDRYHPSTKAHCTLAATFVEAFQKAGLIQGSYDVQAAFTSCRRVAGNKI